MSRLWNMIFGWEEVLVTDNIDQYMKVKSELNNRGIMTRTEFVNNAGRNRGIGSMNNVAMYYIYVKKKQKQ